jgi:hypothetical protein
MPKEALHGINKEFHFKAGGGDRTGLRQTFMNYNGRPDVSVQIRQRSREDLYKD